MNRRLLVLIDFSPNSKEQLLLANKWCLSMQAAMLLVHVPVIVKPALTDPATEKEIIEIEKQKSLIKLKTFAKDILGGTQNIDYHVSEQNLLLLVPQLLNQNYDDLILTGLKGTGTLKKILWGSTTIELIDYVHHPLVAVPKNHIDFLPDTLYIGISQKYPLNTLRLDYIIAFFQDQIKKIVFTSVFDKQEDEITGENQLKSLVAQYSNRIHTSYKIFNGNDASKELKEFITAQNDGILVVQRGSRSLLDQLFRKFLINDLVYDGSVPLIVLPS